MTWFLSMGNSRRTTRSAGRANRQPGTFLQAARRRLVRFEPLEDRALLAALPFGAMPDDTGEFLLGDVHVTVVLMESDPTRAPFDNALPPQGAGLLAEDWTGDAIAAVKAKVEAGMQWWADTLDALPNVRDGLLNFTYDWTHADTPVKTGYEPIARISNDFVLWMYDFLNLVGFNQTGNFSADIRAFNNFQRQQVGADWAFTIFVVNDANDADKMFASGGSFRRAFAFSGGRFMVVPADRPASSFAHEAGHMFWALDEYLGTAADYTARRGYYNTPNTNHASNPAPGFVQEPSIMATGPVLDAGWAANVTSISSMEMIGWRDSDGDGIFDVLDVPFSLAGVGQLDPLSGDYRFTGKSMVRTLPNLNTSGLQNDITINQIRIVEVQLDNGPWVTVQSLPPRTYQADIDISVPVPTGEHIIRIRTHDTRTGVISDVFEAYVEGPPQTTPTPGIGGLVFRDDNANGAWDFGEPPLPDFAIELLTEAGAPVVLQKFLEPSDYDHGTVLNTVHPDVTLSAEGFDAANGNVLAYEGDVPAAGNVFGVRSVTAGEVQTWTSNRQFKAVFSAPVGTVSLRAFSGGGTSFARLEAYNSAGQLVARTTSGGLSGITGTTLSIQRAEGDIAYVVAKGHAGTQVMLDSLDWGPSASATSNVLGIYSLAYLPEGTYKVKVSAPPNHIVTTPEDGEATVTVVAGQSYGVNFGIALQEDLNIWHNFARAEDVNADGVITPLDVLILVNWMNRNPGNALLPTSGSPASLGYLDTSNDGFITPLDALTVVNWLNRNAQRGTSAGEGEPAEGSASAGSGSEGEQGGAEGEERIAPPRTAAEYYARNPVHFLEIVGTDLPCCCQQCTGRREAAQTKATQAIDNLVTGIERALESAAPQARDVLDSLRERLPPPASGTNPAELATGLLRRLRDDAALSSRVQRLLDTAGPAGEQLRERLGRIQSKLDDLDSQLDPAIDALAADVAATWLVRRK